jgi:AraC family transcriptional regulator
MANTSESNGRVNSSFAKPRLVVLPEQPVEGQGPGVGNHGSAGLLASSAGRGWSGLAAELRSHSGVVAFKKPSPHIVLCVDVQGGASVVTRQRGDIKDRTVSERGTIWLSPAEGPDVVIEMSNPLPAILHIFLPPSQFSPKSLGEGSDPSTAASLRFSVRHLRGACSSKRWRRAWRQGWSKTTSARWRTMSPPVRLRQDLIDAD